MAILPPMTKEEFKKKYGYEAFSNTPVAQIETEQPKSNGLLKSIAGGIIKPFARLGTNVVQAGQTIAGKPKTQPFSGNFLGEVKPVGQTGRGFGADVKDSIGVGLEVASTILPVGGGAKVAGQLGKGALLSATKTGAKIGTTSGGLQGVGSGLQENQGLIQTGLEGAGGAIAGGLLGGVLGGFSTLAANRLAKVGALPKRNQELLRNEAREIVTPATATMSKLEKVAGIEGGRYVSPKSIFQKGMLKMTEGEKEVADSVVGLVRKKNSMEKNITNIATEIGNKSRKIDAMMEKEVVAPISYEKLQDAILNVKSDAQFLFTKDASAESNYDAVVDLFKSKLVDSNFNLIQARREFDKEVNKRFPKLLSKIGSGEVGDTGKLWAVQDIRRMANDLAEESLPAGNTLKADLRYISNLYKARRNIAKNNIADMDKTTWEKFWGSGKGRVLKQALIVGGSLAVGKTVLGGE